MVRSATVVCFMFVGTAHANERSAELVKSFQAFCAAAPLDFAALDAQATAMKLAVRKDVGTPQQTGKFARSKSWLVPLDSRLARAYRHRGARPRRRDRVLRHRRRGR